MHRFHVVAAGLLFVVPSLVSAAPFTVESVSTQTSPAAGCKQIELAVGLSPSECGTKTDAELAEMMLDKGDE
ncbi:hypothetical protein AAD018_015210 [Aestuariibius insulae]|uniref:hypothetical protein n=1 Tax=Aestuariibius insulae TaxID=2058287 RepID=UPI00345E5AA8